MEIRKVKIQRFGSNDYAIYNWHGIHLVYSKKHNAIVSCHVIEFSDGEIHKIELDEPYHITLLPIQKT